MVVVEVEVVVGCDDTHWHTYLAAAQLISAVGRMCMSCLSVCLRAPHRRQMHGASEDDVAVPPLLKTALVWGLFMGVSSNLRYQVCVM